MLLLLPSSPVAVVKNPFARTGQKLPAAPDTRYTNQSKSPRSIYPTDVFEAEKLERFRSPASVAQTCNGCETSEENAPCLLLSQLQSKFCEPFPHLLLELVRVLPKLKSHHKVISKTRQIRLASAVRLDFLLKPQIENEMQIKVAQQG